MEPLLLVVRDTLRATAVALVSSVVLWWTFRIFPDASLRRLVASAPLVLYAAFAAVHLGPRPHQVPEGGLILTAASALNLGFLAPVKALAGTVGRGPLADPRLSWGQFVCLHLLPILATYPGDAEEVMIKKAKPRKKDDRRSDSRRHHRRDQDVRRLVVSCILHLGLALAVAAALQAPVPSSMIGSYMFPRHVAYVVGLHGILATLLDLAGAVACAVVRLDPRPHHQNPLLASTSVADFWRRWNIVTAQALRMITYDPITEGSLVKKEVFVQYTDMKENADGRTVRRKRTSTRSPSVIQMVTGTWATFIASAVMHEYMMYVLTGNVSYQGRWTLFFALQGPLVVAESQLRRAWASSDGILRRWVYPCLSGIGLLWMGSHLFMVPCDKSGLTGQVMREMETVHTWLLRTAGRGG
jgi:hypothetical protein